MYFQVQVEIVHKYPNNPEDVCFNTFNAHFFSLRVCVSFIPVALSHRRGDMAQKNTITEDWCSDYMELRHVLMLSVDATILYSIMESDASFLVRVHVIASGAICLSLLVCSARWEYSACSFI